MVKIYGCSDDLVEIEGSRYENEIGCFDRYVRFWFTDNTVITIGYPKKNMGVWWIKVNRKGTAPQKLTVCEDEDAEIYSDIFEIDSEITMHLISDYEIGESEYDA
ncbi:MAG: hypothetical protein J5938_05435 [Clostridia bacterium]|nr:hypothetical protein [Clostridia bacterium]